MSFALIKLSKHFYPIKTVHETTFLFSLFTKRMRLSKDCSFPKLSCIASTLLLRYTFEYSINSTVSSVVGRRNI